MKTKQIALRLAVVAVAFVAACFVRIQMEMEQTGRKIRRGLADILGRMSTFFWLLELKRLVGIAERRSWTVQFVHMLPGDALGFGAGVALHADKTIKVRTYGLSKRQVAETLRHELEHAAGAGHARAPAWLRCMGTWGPIANAVSYAFETVAGSTLAVSTTAPATYDLAGYSASGLVYTIIGEITDIGPFSRTYATVNHNPIAERQVTQKKGSFTLDPIELMMAWDGDDAGQVILRAAEATDAILTFELVKQGGDQRYFTAQVSKVSENFGGADNVNQAAITLLPQKVFIRDPE